ncbi:hypothetical protein BKA62DRAFT_68654 [Auriculariales sp. MPI-PUGE-AT-0066]|nr:hypothetical protein BKA62DRAFT_68654 [Auriculariales sp. MPI-PUGE-AT-0066]
MLRAHPSWSPRRIMCTLAVSPCSLGPAAARRVSSDPAHADSIHPLKSRELLAHTLHWTGGRCFACPSWRSAVRIVFSGCARTWARSGRPGWWQLGERNEFVLSGTSLHNGRDPAIHGRSW